MKKCSKCSGKLKTVGFFRTKGWECTKCKGTFVKYRYLSYQELLADKLDKVAGQCKNSKLKCLECGTTMKLLQLGKIGLELDFCPNDYNIWFDFKEPQRFMKWFDKNAPKGWKNSDEPSTTAVMAAIYFSGS